MTNPYTPPGTPVKDPPDARRRSSLGAIALGLLADVGGSIAFGTVLQIVIGIVFAVGGAPPEAIGELARSPGFQLVGVAIGLAFSVVGGYVAARFANHSEYANAFAVGVLSLLSGEAILLLLPDDYPFWLRILGDLMVIPAALLGGHLRALQKRPAT